ncbi:MAG: tetratricopeptide repeat protein [Deltaproteobacteria bacterium]|nr:tetratricopeptide repeat protein [Deltaproteobacteria bacterium]
MRTPRPIAMLCMLLTLSLARAAAGDPADAARRAIEQRAMRAMADSNWSAALAALSELEAQPGMRLHARLLGARVHFLAGRIAQAARAYELVAKSARPGSELGRKARFGLSECRARERDYKRAESLFSAALDQLVSAERQAEFVALFARLGDEQLDPPAERRAEADPAKAEHFFQAALDLGPASALAEALVLKVARCRVEQKRHRDAADYLIDYLLKREQQAARGRKGDAGTEPERLVEIQLAIGENLLEANDLREARRYLRKVMDGAGRSDMAAKAAYATARTYRMPHPGSWRELARGQEALARFIRDFPAHADVPKARLELALAPMHLRRHAEAEDRIRELLGVEGLGEEVMAEARYQLGVCLAGQGRYAEAAGAYRSYLQAHPAHEHWSEARQGIEDAAWQEALRIESAAQKLCAERTSRGAGTADKAEQARWAEAAAAFSRFAEKHPASPRAPQALLRTGQAFRKAGRIDQALAVLGTLSAKFAQDPTGQQGLMLAGEIHEQDRGDFARAREIYEKAKKLPHSTISAQADARLQILERPSMLVASPDTFTSDRKPKLDLKLRNLEEVSLRSWRIQAEDYFRDRMQMQDVTGLDIALCSPDRTWKVPVKPYRKYARIEQAVELPFDKPGLYLLNLAAGELEATTAVLVTDLALVVKTGAREVFVFAQDMRRMRAAAGVELLVSDGERILLQGRSGADGVWRAELPEDAEPDELVVFGLRDGHLAWTGQSGPSVQVPTQRVPRAFVFSERPAYRPGDPVHLAGIFREVRDGRYHYQPGDKLRLDVQRPDGLSIHHGDVVLDDYGSFHQEIALDPTAPQGHYSFSISHGSGEQVFQASGSFQVVEFRRLAHEIEIRLDKPVFFRGEPVSGTVQVRHRQGSPAIDEHVLIDFASRHELFAGRTDAHGRVRFSFATDRFEENRKLSIQAQLTRTFQQVETSTLLAVEGLAIELALDDPRLFAGQPFGLRVKVRDPLDRPSAARVTVEALQRDAQTNAERRVLTQDVEIGESGSGRVELRLPEEGSFVLRAFARDRQGQLVLAELGAVIGKQAQALSLTLDSEIQTLGRTARVTLHSELDAALVLLTGEAERVLVHRAVRVARGANAVDWPVTAALAPNFQLAAAALVGDKLHQTARAVEVRRDLEIRVRPDSPQSGPGEEVALTLIARDASGKPVDARLIVSVVDQALLDAYPEKLPDLIQTFHSPRAIGTVLTSASVAFRFPEVEAQEVEKAEVREAEGSAAMAALKTRRRVMTEEAREKFSDMSGMQVGAGGLGTVGHGMGGGGVGYGRGVGRPSIRAGKAMIRGGLARGWRSFFPETALFTAALRTGPDGVATVHFRLPDTITAWRVCARGVSKQTHVGESRAEIVARRLFWAELALPPELEQGDAVAPVARLFNDTPADRKVHLRFEHAGKTTEADLDVAARRSGELVLPEIRVPEGAAEIQLALEAQAGPGAVDKLRKTVPVRPRGVREQIAVQGMLEGRASHKLDLADGLNAPELEIRLSTRLERFYLATDLDPLLFGDRPEAALAALALHDLLVEQGETAMLDLVRSRLRASLQRIIEVQASDGGWGWSRQAQGSNVPCTAAALQALARARPLAGRIGWVFPQASLDRAQAWLDGELVRLAPDDFQARAEILYALAHLGQDRVPFVHLHRLHRLRKSLELGSAALLGLTWHRLGRPEQATEVADDLGAKLDFSAAEPASLSERWQIAWPSDLDRIRALHLLVLTRPRDPRVARGRAWLHARGRSLGWAFPRQAAAALELLGRLETARASATRVMVRARLNGEPAGEATLGRDGRLERIQVRPALIRSGANELALELEGAGSCFYTATLSGHRSIPNPPSAAPPIQLVRHVEPVPEPYRGKPISAGFSCVVAEPGERWTNDVTRIPARRQVEVSLTAVRRFVQPIIGAVIEERIPPGFELVPDSMRGQFTHMMQQGRRLAFFMPPTGTTTRLSYRLAALHPGAYRFAPARLVSLSSPDLFVLSPGGEFQIDRADGPLPQIRPTPDELHGRGMAAAAENDHGMVLEMLEPLLTRFTLRADRSNPVLSALLFASIGTQDHARILKYFEIAKEKNPDLIIPFDKVGPVRQAYRKLGAHEGGLHLGRGLAEAQFLKEVRSVGLLESEGELAEALAMLRALLGSYPDNNLSAQATYAFSQVVYSRADAATEGENLRGFDRPGLLDEVAALMARFLGLYPEDPQAPEATFSIASAFIERERAEQAVRWCEVGLRRHVKSALAPALAYLKAFAHFRLGDYNESMKLCKKVADEDQGDNRDMAIYIMAQIEHARGRTEPALKLYKRVQTRFRDAAETIRELTREHYAVPEVLEIEQGRPALLEVEASNLTELDLRAYRVDLMKLYLLKRSLGNLGEVNLAGIEPVLSTRVRLKPPPAGGRFEQSVPLRLRGKGAYLLIVRGGSRTTHCLVLLDSLSCEVQRSADGRVRVTMREARGRSVPGARVQLKGEADERFTVGKTDLRGVFVADGIEGPVTAIAMHRDAYGLYRERVAPRDGEEGDGEAYDQPPQPSVQYKKQTVYDFDDDMIQGELQKPDGSMLLQRRQAKDFFNQNVEGMSVKQAK